MKYTKIVCTIGPASEKTETLKKMILSGMDVARLNFSHGTHSNHKILMKNIRQASVQVGKPIGIIQDLSGPKIRIGELKKPLVLKAGTKIFLGKKGIPVQYDLAKIVAKGQRVLIDDGLIELRVEKVLRGSLECSVIIGGTIVRHKGINVPESNTNFSVFTAKDKKDLIFGLKNNVDFVAMSFVRNASDIIEVKNFIKKRIKKDIPWIIAKIEKSQAIKNLDEIIAASDAIMVARGDLGIEAAEEEVPVFQKIIIKKCLQARKPVIVATQMLDSMIRNPRPTRAEVSDVANAVLDHTDATMLSAESAFGKYPLESVATMDKVIRAAEESYFDLVKLQKNFAKHPMVVSAINFARKHKVPVVIYSPQGQIAREFASLRQEFPLFTFSSSENITRKLALVWELHSYYIKDFGGQKQQEEQILKVLAEKKLLPQNSKVVLAYAKQQKAGDALISVQLKTVQ